jgi:phospholipid/cholesterol/gamma-HCH transport system substrate-binding protein
VGIFVAASLLVLGIVVFMIGEERKLFSERQFVRAAFKDVKGLSRGSPVRMGGVDIGAVDSINYAADQKDDTIFVRMSVVKDQARRIRQDSIAEVKDKGLLGDKMIVVTVGSPEQPPVQEEGLVKTEESRDLEQILEDLKSTARGAERVMANLEKTTDAFAEDKFHEDIKRTVTHLSEIMQKLNEGDGYVPRLLSDKGEADKISATVGELKLSAAELRQLLASARMVVDRVRTGPGFAHEVLYEEKGSEAITQVGGAADELRLALKGVREQRSLVHDVLYEKDSGEMIQNLNRTTADLQSIVADIKSGKGTLGAFLVDPSVYEDVKVLLGNVSRNRSLRALVRYSIKQDEEHQRVIAPEGAPAEGSGSAQAEASPSGASLP